MTRIFKVAFLTVGLAAGLTACPGPVVKKPPAKADKPDGTTEAAPPDKGDKAASEAPATDKGDKPADPPKGW
jgi:hypothetical protein